MKVLIKKEFLFFILSFIILIAPSKVASQDFTLSEAVQYIDNRLKSDYFLKIENNNLIVNRGSRISSKVSINNLESVEISDSRELGVKAYCKNMNKCSTVYLPDGYSVNFDEFTLYTEDYESAELVANALRYIIDNFQKESSQSDPFASYSSKNKRNDENSYSDSFDFNKIELGMNKEEVFKIFGEYAKLESIEVGYKVYRVMKNYETYFFYFSNNSLTRIDRGERSPDAVILIRE